MKLLNQYIFEYKQRTQTHFDYDKIKDAIQNCKPKFFGNHVSLDILFTPEIYFIYAGGGWSTGKPSETLKRKYGDYKCIQIDGSSIISIEFFAERNLIKRNEVFGRIDIFSPTCLTDEDKENWQEIDNFLKSKFNAEVSGPFGTCKYIKFETYEELESILKELDRIINTYNKNYSKNSPSYLYFNKSEAMDNANYKRDAYIASIDEKISQLNNKLDVLKQAQQKTKIDLRNEIDNIKDQIKYLEIEKRYIHGGV